ncbi:hypothetical protein NNO07_22620 [Pseudomonas resinovorans]|uniref:Lipoprotein n=1 Tax=Metapseudomonas resinovorans TaxID=53412 RepID=A0ABT4YAX0_METRE|nr:hypothetical protein [Pseudomonas resinovorans]MDA8485871.1 hypothetical protein [Pseudomonas resinovorans]
MRAISFALLSLTAALTMTGCTNRIADLTVASTKNFNMNSTALETGRRVEGNDTIAVVLIPLGEPNIKEAIDRAVERERCAVGLSNVVIDQEFFVFLFGYVKLNVEGNLILDRGLPGCGGMASQYYQPAPAQSQESVPSHSANEAQLERLNRDGLSYEEYQRRYREIVGQ